MRNSNLQILCFLALFSSLHLQAQTANNDILGVHKYQAETFEGMSILTPTHFIWIINNKDRPSFASGEPTVAEKARAFESLNIGAGTWEATGKNRNKVTYTHHINHTLVGSSFEYEYEMEGDLNKYWIIQQNGERGEVNYSRKVASWEAPGSCSLYNGVWAYEDFGEDGIYIQSGNYGAWIILNEIVEDISTDARKAKAFDALLASFTVGDCQGGEVDYFHVIHSSDPRNEKGVIGGSSTPINAGSFSMQILNAGGQPAGSGFKVHRIDKK